MLHKYLIILFTTISTIAFSQNACQCDSFEYEKYFDEKLVGRAFINPNLKNKIQFFNNWTKGDVILSNGLVAQNKMLRYNGYVDELVWLRKSDYQVAVMNRLSIDGFVLYNEDGSVMARFKKMKVKVWYAIDSLEVYLQELTNGPLTFYVHRKVMSNNTDTEFFEEFQYFISRNGTMNSIFLKRWDLMRIVKDDKPRMRKAIWSEYLRVKKEPQMIRAIELYNKSLLEDK